MRLIDHVGVWELGTRMRTRPGTLIPRSKQQRWERSVIITACCMSVAVCLCHSQLQNSQRYSQQSGCRSVAPWYMHSSSVGILQLLCLPLFKPTLVSLAHLFDKWNVQKTWRLVGATFRAWKTPRATCRLAIVDWHTQVLCVWLHSIIADDDIY